MKRFVTMVISIAILTTVAGAVYYFHFKEDTSGNTISDELFGWKYPVAQFPSFGSDWNQLAYSDIRDPGGLPEGLPIRLKIPSISVDSAIEDARITPDGRMDVPYGSVNVAWFALGPYPGRVGSAVIGGHFGINNGVKFVFYDLDKLKEGDKVYVVDDKGDTLAFQVRATELFNRNDDATRVFTSDDGRAHLNLITCEGLWNQVNDTYPLRRVVYTDAIQEEGAVVVPKAKVTFPRTMSIGARGNDVIALQTTLEQRGFLTMPRGVAKGYFGTLTRTALAKYQVSVGLSGTGVFNTTTRDRLLSGQPPVAVKPTLPPTAIITPKSSLVSTPLSASITTSIKSLFATVQDGLITCALLILIMLIISNIMRGQKKLSSLRPVRQRR